MLVKSASIWNQLETAGVPGIKGVWGHPDGHSDVARGLYFADVPWACQASWAMAATIPAGTFYGGT